jgi:hypothetical protein
VESRNLYIGPQSSLLVVVSAESLKHEAAAKKQGLRNFDFL